MTTVTLSKIEYRELKDRAKAYDQLLKTVTERLFTLPPEKSVKKVVSEFKKTGHYNAHFLASLERGLARSTYFSK